MKVVLNFIVILSFCFFSITNTLNSQTKAIKGYYKTNEVVVNDSMTNDSCLVKGRIYDAQTHLPITYAWVKLKGSNLGVITDISGNYSLKIPVGKYRLDVISKPNIDLTTRRIKFKASKQMQIDFYLGGRVIY